MTEIVEYPNCISCGEPYRGLKSAFGNTEVTCSRCGNLFVVGGEIPAKRMIIKYVLGIDPGKTCGWALYEPAKDRIVVMDTFRIPNDHWTLRAAARLTKEIELACKKASIDLEPFELAVVIEAPSTRFYGRANASAILRTFWLAHNLFEVWLDNAEFIMLLDSYDWNERPHGNGQRTDKEKKIIFYRLFPNAPKKTNTDVRDAALVAEYGWRHLKLQPKLPVGDELPF